METRAVIEKTTFRLWLQSKLMEKIKANPRYSLRAFANYLEMDASSVSQILSGKRKASTKVINQIGEKLSLSPIQLNQFLKEGSRSKTNSLNENTDNYELIAEDAFAYTSNWYHGAILELTFIESFRNDPQWIANTLSISVTEVKMAIERMIRIGILTEEDKTLKKTNKFLTNFRPGLTSSAHKELQRQILKKGLEAIDNCPQEDKDITSMTMSIDIDKLPEAKKLIEKFRRDLCQFLEDGQQSRVYQLGIQLYPLSKETNLKSDIQEIK